MDEDPPEISVTEMTADQLAKLALFAQPIIGWGVVALFYDEPPDDGGPAVAQVRRHRCPIILWRGARRKILPNGDICETSAAND